MKTKLKFIVLLPLLSMIIVLLAFQQSKRDISRRLLIGKWKTENASVPPYLEFHTDSTAYFSSETQYKYYVKYDTIFLSTPKGENKKMHISKLNKDTLQYELLGARFDYWRVR